MSEKKKRTHKISQGIHGASKHPLSELEKALLGKGVVARLRHVPIKSPWRGVAFVTTPYDAKTVAENRLLYPHLFREDD